MGSTWPDGFDLVVLGGNCFYELANIEEQEGCIRAAASCSQTRGFLFLDNDHMEGDLKSELARYQPHTMFPFWAM